MTVLQSIYFYVIEFNAYNFMIGEKMLVVFVIINAFGLSSIISYLGYIYSIKKSYKATKIIAKKYKIWQRIWLVHYNENVYRKVDKSAFNFIYHVYHVHLITVIVTVFALLFSIKFNFFNEITCILFYLSMLLAMIENAVYIFATRTSPLGGAEFRSEAKYRGKKNW